MSGLVGLTPHQVQGRQGIKGCRGQEMKAFQGIQEAKNLTQLGAD